MKRSIRDFFSYGNALPVAILGTAMTALLSIAALDLLTDPSRPAATITMESSLSRVLTGDQIVLDVIVEASIPVNVFAGEIAFNPDVLTVASIDYDISIAELWVEEPWFKNGAGTLNFAGGTTKPGGFTGSGKLITITFDTNAPGEGLVSLQEGRILEHNGLGSDVALGQTLDEVFLVRNATSKENLIVAADLDEEVTVLDQLPNTDLNNDGQQNLIDMSIFMNHLLSQNLNADFNLDGKVNTVDLSILIQR